jgi:hypothetical protein
MTLLHDAVEAKKFDTRVLERNLTRGVITDAEVKKAAQALPDDAAAGEFVSIESLTDSDDR